MKVGVLQGKREPMWRATERLQWKAPQILTGWL